MAAATADNSYTPTPAPSYGRTHRPGYSPAPAYGSYPPAPDAGRVLKALELGVAAARDPVAAARYLFMHIFFNICTCKQLIGCNMMDISLCISIWLE